MAMSSEVSSPELPALHPPYHFALSCRHSVPCVRVALASLTLQSSWLLLMMVSGPRQSRPSAMPKLLVCLWS